VLHTHTTCTHDYVSFRDDGKTIVKVLLMLILEMFSYKL